MIEPIALAVFTSLSWASAGTLIKGFSSRYGSMVAAFAIALGNLMLIGLVLLLLGNFSMSAYSVALSLVGGVFTSIGYLLFYMSLKGQQASNTFATIEVQAVLLVLYGALVLNESVVMGEALGVALVIAGIFMVSIEKGRRFNKGLLPAIAAQFFWALGWIALVYPIAHSTSSLLPVWISFVADIMVVSAAMLISKEHRAAASRVRPRYLSTGIVAGMFSSSGNMLYSVLISLKQLVIGTAISNTSPAVVAVFAHFVYHDRLTRLQVAGLAAVVIGGVILGMY